jgi:hypothetical protein
MQNSGHFSQKTEVLFQSVGIVPTHQRFSRFSPPVLRKSACLTYTFPGFGFAAEVSRAAENPPAARTQARKGRMQRERQSPLIRLERSPPAKAGVWPPTLLSGNQLIFGSNLTGIVPLCPCGRGDTAAFNGGNRYRRLPGRLGCSRRVLRTMLGV